MLNSLDFLRQYFLTQGLTISCAESCTGGLVSDRLVQKSGSSKYFKGAIIAYSRQIKEDFLLIPSSLIDEKGIASKEVAIAMALACKKQFATDWAISSTGWVTEINVGQKKQKPVVYIGVLGPNIETAIKLNFNNEPRNKVRENSVTQAFNFLEECIKNKTK